MKEFTDLLPETIIGKSDEEIKKIIQNMIDTFENSVKPSIFSVELFWRELNYLATSH